MSNRLAGETSPYLRQHADNPVDWFPWGEEAFAAARERDVPILLSVGYSACHWCHVMAHESFEDPETAALMNRPLRQREGRPRGAARRRRDLHGGDAGDDRPRRLADDGVHDRRRQPFFAGTYFPKCVARRHGLVHRPLHARRRGLARRAATTSCPGRAAHRCPRPVRDARAGRRLPGTRRRSTAPTARSAPTTTTSAAGSVVRRSSRRR